MSDFQPSQAIGASSCKDKKKRKFVANIMAKRAIPRTPLVKDLVFGVPQRDPREPPPYVLTRLGPSCPYLMAGIDIETHDWVYRTGNKANVGQFGHYSLCHPDDFDQRIVQIGWAVGSLGQAAVVKERIVFPEGFCVSKKAFAKHGISQEEILKDGINLKTVLSEFLNDMVEVYKKGGRIVSHHLEFDCGIILEEMKRNEVPMQSEWCAMAKEGVCTMDPTIGKWVHTCFGRDTGPDATQNTMRLQVLAEWLVPESRHLRDKAHTAGADAQLHRLLYFEFLKLACIVPNNDL
jgi:DNA polymerase III epsilon subunit-like protein